MNVNDEQLTDLNLNMLIYIQAAELYLVIFLVFFCLRNYSLLLIYTFFHKLQVFFIIGLMTV
ncbi:hypothetical protein AAEX37_02325 [Oligella sp. MSHR50489EDL]